MRPEPFPPADAAVAALCRGFSLELAPPAAGEIPTAAAALAAGTEVFIAALPRLAPARLVGAATALAGAGFRPVPHLAARRLGDYAEARDFVRRLVGEAGVERVLVVGGDLAVPRGGFASALELLSTDLLARSGVQRVALAGYPEGHPRLGAATLAEALQAKLAIAASQGLAASIVTQFCFEAAPILDWIRRLRGAGVAVPVHVGLAGRTSARTLLKFALRCGVGASMRALGSHASSLLHLAREAGPEPAIRALAAQRRPEDGIAGLHFFSFGGFARTARDAARLAEGRIDDA